MRLKLFIAMCVLGGVGGFVGSVIGAVFGARGLFVGGFIGGLLIAPMSGKIALWRGWISAHQYWPTVVGAAVGFLAAAFVAVNTLSSPVGPILSTTLTGIGALIGSRLAPNRR